MEPTKAEFNEDQLLQKNTSYARASVVYTLVVSTLQQVCDNTSCQDWNILDAREACRILVVGGKLFPKEHREFAMQLMERDK